MQEKEILEDFYLLKKGGQLGYGPTTQIMTEDSIVISYKDKNNQLNQEFMPIQQSAIIKDIIKESLENEKIKIEEKESLSSIINKKQSLSEYFAAKKDKYSGKTELDLEKKYSTFSNKITQIENYRNLENNNISPKNKNRSSAKLKLNN